MAKLTFYGAIKGVTGSMYLLRTDDSQILLDYGLFQGRREEEELNMEPLPFDISKIDAVVLSHAHLDHSGRLPLLVSQGFEGPIYMTSPNCGGRIRHHLNHNLWRKQSHVLFVGFQAIGTPGRALVDGAEMFRVAGEEIVVRAEIHTLGGFSAHAGQSQLLDWLSNFDSKKTRLYLVHGETGAKMALQEAVRENGWEASIPQQAQEIEF